MTLPRIFIVVSLFIFGAIAIAGYSKKGKPNKEKAVKLEPIEIPIVSLQAANPVPVVPEPVEAPSLAAPAQENGVAAYPEVDRVQLLFQKDSPLPLVKTITYKSRVLWKMGKPAWLVDYASHYKTHVHFIARSLNGKPDYFPKAANEGDRFNIYNPDVNSYFYLVIDTSRCKLRLYAVMPDANERVLLKTYRVGLGRKDGLKPSRCLTPIGKYSLGARTALFSPRIMGTHKGKRVEMITVFGTRWIPFEKEIENCSEPAKGFGIHGTPWHKNPQGRLVDNTQSIGGYESDGCIRLSQRDIEELFAIIAMRTAIVDIVFDFSKSKLPGNEKIY